MQAAGKILSPRQTTGGQERKENTQRENASTQNAPSGRHEEAKTEHQVENVNLNDAFNPPVKDKPLEPTVSPVERALNATERNLCFSRKQQTKETQLIQPKPHE